MDLAESRRVASQLSGGTSSEVIKRLVIECLQSQQFSGTLIDFGAGKGELLTQLANSGKFEELAGIDLFPRPTELDPRVSWFQQDLNESLRLDLLFDCVVCSETIEHLENPRQTFRSLSQLLKPGGLLVLTMPNQESIRSYIGLLFGGHFTMFLGSCYPAHITALLRTDLLRLCQEVNLAPPQFRFTNSGAIPKITKLTWQGVSLGMLRGRLFSDNIAMTTRKANTPLTADPAD